MIEVIGKNGSGKSYITNKLYEYGFERNVGYTTRQKRSGEIDGVDYFFISETEFKNKILHGEFVDYKIINGNYYGIIRRNLTENSILVSGNSEKIEKETGIKVKKIYINCDIAIRYKRVLMRNDLTINNFNRFHSENFSFLDDFEAIFIDNNSDNDDSLNQIIERIMDDNNKELITNRKFLEREVKRIAIESIILNEDKMLAMLMYEEYLLRKYFLEKDCLIDDTIIDKYYKNLLHFAKYIGLNGVINANGLFVEIDNQEYNFDYLRKRLVKK